MRTGLVSFLVVLLLVHGMIQGDWQVFIEQYLRHAASRRPEWIIVIPAFFGLALSRYSWIFLLALVLASTFLIMDYRKQKGYSSGAFWFFCAGWGTVGLVLLYPYAVALAFYFFPLFCFSALWSGVSGRERPLRVLAMVLTLLAVHQVQRFLSVMMSPRVNILPQITEVSSTTRRSGKSLVFDEYAYRYVLHMKPGYGDRAWFYLEPGIFAPDTSYWTEQQVWLVSEPYLGGGLVDPRGSDLVIFTGNNKAEGVLQLRAEPTPKNPINRDLGR